MRIYLDKNIFSYLRTHDEYNELLQKIENSIEQHTFFYSQAHIEDLKNDKTEIKYKDLDFIERIAGKNYLCKCWKKPTNCYSVSPREAFTAAEEEEIIDFNFKEILEHPLFKEKAKLVESFFLGSERPSADVSMFHPLINDYLNNIFSQTDSFNIEKLINDGLDFYNSLNNDIDVYKSLRRYLKENQQVLFNEMPEKLADCDLDRLFYNSLFKSTFIEYVEKNISVKTESSDEKLYYTFSTAYQILNTLGLDSEKNKKSKFKNTNVDGSHAYYAGFCDILVTDDNGLIEKGQKIYTLFNLDTKIIHVSNFLVFLESINEKNRLIQESLQDVLLDDLKNGQKIENVEDDDVFITHIKPVLPYYSVFNSIQINIKKQTKQTEHIFLSTSSKRLHTIFVYKEIQQITDFLLNFFAPGHENLIYFDRNIEINQINDNTWPGRFWKTPQGYIHLGIYSKGGVMYLDICLNQNTSS